MNFCEAVNYSKNGYYITSNLGIRYKPEDLAPISCGRNWAIISSKNSMTKAEREGEWRAE